MRKVLLSLVAIAAAVFATSCTNDLLDEGVKGGNRVTFNISTPELATRAFGDGATATDLYYAVYEGNTLLNDISVTPGETPVKLQGGKTSIMLDLASGIEYNLIFWAAAPDAIDKLYEVDFATKSMSLIDPAKLVSQDENLDAFYAYVDEVEAGKDEDVELYRPFAQLNISVSDADILAAKNANLEVAETKVVVKNAYKTLNLVNGTVADEVAYTFDFAALPTGDNAADFPKADYTRYAMNYLLVDDTKKLVEVEFAYNRAVDANAVNTRTFGNVPVQRNYRTNIYGDLLTKSTGFEVEIMEEWTEPAYGKVWDGVSIAVPSIDETNKAMYIHDGYQLAWFAAKVNGATVDDTNITRAETTFEANNYKEWTIKLTSDIDLGGYDWTPIGNKNDGSPYKNNFDGIFDGQGYTIKNLKVDVNNCAGLFGNTCGVTIKNLTIDGFELKSNHYAGAILAWGETGSRAITIENCHVKNGNIAVSAEQDGNGNWDNGDKVGAVVGWLHYGTVKGCSADNINVKAYRDLGGILGYGNATTLENNKVNNVTLEIDNSQNYKNYTEVSKHNAKAIVGRWGEKACVETNNSGEAVVVYEGVVINPDGSYSLNEEEGMQTLIDMLPEGEETTVKLEDGNYVVDNAAGKNIRFIANGEDVNLDITATNHASTTFTGADLYFEGVNFNVEGNDWYGSGSNSNKYFTKSNSETYVNCTFYKYHYFSAKKALVKDCVFTGVEGSYFWTGAAAEVEFDGCTFNGVDRALKVASVVKAAAPLKVTINNCDFTATVSNKAVLEIGAPAPTNDFVVEVKNSNRNSVFNGWYAIEAGNNVDINIDEDAIIVNNASELTAVLAALNAANGGKVVLADGEYAGKFYITNKNITLEAANKHKATIKGRVGVGGNSTSVATFKGLNFEVTAETAEDFDFSTNVNKTTGYVIGNYCGNMTVVDCNFSGLTDDYGAIQYGSYQSGGLNGTVEKLIVKNCSFDGGRAIRSRSNVSVTDCEFKGLLNPCLQIVGLGDFDLTSTVEFKNNTSDVAVNGVTIKTSNQPTKYVTFDVSGNTNCNTIAHDTKKVANLYPETYTFIGDVKNIIVEE